MLFDGVDCNNNPWILGFRVFPHKMDFFEFRPIPHTLYLIAQKSVTIMGIRGNQSQLHKFF